MAKLPYKNIYFINNPVLPFSKSEKDSILGVGSKNYLVSAPLEQSVSGVKGTKNGPKELIQWSSQVELYEPLTKTYPSDKGIYTTKPLKFGKDIKHNLDVIERDVYKYLNADKFVGVLGGEHTITYANVKAACKHLNEPITVIVLDAHPDLYNDFYGEKYSHANVFKRLLDDLNDNINLIQVGIRAYEQEEEKFAQKDKRVTWVKAIDIYDKLDGSTWLKGINTQKMPKKVWLSIDTDFFDSGVISATGTPVAGGLTWWPTIKFLQQIYKTFDVVGFDVVEFCPNNDTYSAKNTADLVYKCFGFKG